LFRLFTARFYIRLLLVLISVHRVLPTVNFAARASSQKDWQLRRESKQLPQELQSCILKSTLMSDNELGREKTEKIPKEIAR